MRRFEHRIPGKRFIVKGKRLCGQRWTNLRNKWLRSFPVCARCGMPGEEVHHVIARAQRPDLMYDLNNLQTLCKKCHLGVHGEKPHY
jgi:5-methylcytosine-specific restriction endonuclease McrA